MTNFRNNFKFLGNNKTGLFISLICQFLSENTHLELFKFSSFRIFEFWDRLFFIQLKQLAKYKIS